MLMMGRGRRHCVSGSTPYVIWQQCVSRQCPELVPSIIIFLSTSKRLMSPQNSTRKVNTILKCQEINDIVLFFLWSCRSGWQMSCPFHSFPSHLWSASHSLSLRFFPSLIFPPFLCLLLVLLHRPSSPDTEDSSPRLFINAAAQCRWLAVRACQ